MEEYLESEVIDRMYIERGKVFENCVTKQLLETEKDIQSNLELKLEKKFKNIEELIDILDDISLLCNINCKTYYKMGIVDGLKLNQEVKTLSEKMNASK